jgi:integrase
VHIVAHILNRLTNRFVKTAKPAKGKTKEYFLDGGGLYLCATLSADGERVARSWVFRFELNGVRGELGLGATHTITLAEARELARDCRKLLLQGINPLEDKKAKARAEESKRGALVTFETAMQQYFDLHRPQWSAIHAKQWKRSLELHALPLIGKLPCAEVTTPHIRSIVDPLWVKRTETASRTLQRLEVVLAFAKTRGYRAGENPATGLLTSLPKKSKITKVESFESVPYQQIGDAFAKLAAKNNSLVAKALMFQILCASRPGEVVGTRPGEVGATWREVDLEAKVWTIPGEKMKNREEHVVPLSDAAITLLKSVPRKGERVFNIEGAASHKMRYLLQTLPGLKDKTPHGFRSSFRTWAEEQTRYRKNAVEASLAHSIAENATESAYNRAKFLEERRQIMRAWATYCGTPSSVPAASGDVVVPIRGKKKA